MLLQVHPIISSSLHHRHRPQHPIISREICTSVKETKWLHLLPPSCQVRLRQVNCVQWAIVPLYLEGIVKSAAAVNTIQEQALNQCIIAACVLEVYFECVAYQCAPMTRKHRHVVLHLTEQQLFRTVTATVTLELMNDCATKERLKCYVLYMYKNKYVHIYIHEMGHAICNGIWHCCLPNRFCSPCSRIDVCIYISFL